MKSKIERKKEISFATSLLEQIQKYPTEIAEINVEITRNQSRLKSLDKEVVNEILADIFKIIKRNTKKVKIDLATINFEFEFGYEPGEHIFVIRVLLVSQDFKRTNYLMRREIQSEILEEIKANGWLKFKSVDKTGLFIDLIPINTGVADFLIMREKNQKDKNFYTDEVIDLIFSELKVVTPLELTKPQKI
jgi:alpha-amylase/alpha-mannosidase (GH57 family)